MSVWLQVVKKAFHRKLIELNSTLLFPMHAVVAGPCIKRITNHYSHLHSNSISNIMIIADFITIGLCHFKFNAITCKPSGEGGGDIIQTLMGLSWIFMNISKVDLRF